MRLSRTGCALWRSRHLSANQSRNGGDEEDRTPDLGIANAALSQLSYVPIPAADIIGPAGVWKRFAPGRCVSRGAAVSGRDDLEMPGLRIAPVQFAVLDREPGTVEFELASLDGCGDPGKGHKV